MNDSIIIRDAVVTDIEAVLKSKMQTALFSFFRRANIL